MKFQGALSFFLALSVCPTASLAMGKRAPTAPVSSVAVTSSTPNIAFLETYLDGDEAADCYGVWISPTQILTAAHCVISAVRQPERVGIYDPRRYPTGLWSEASNIRVMDQAGCPKGDVYQNSSVCPAHDLAIVETNYAMSLPLIPLSKEPQLTENSTESESLFTAIYPTKMHHPGSLIFEPLAARESQPDGTATLKLNRKWSSGTGPGISGMPVFGLDRGGRLSILGIITGGKKHFLSDVTLFGMDLGSAKARSFITP